MKPGRLCSFCARTADEVELMFQGEIGGMPPLICSECVETYLMVLELHRKHPEKVEQMVADINAQIREKGRVQ